MFEILDLNHVGWIVPKPEVLLFSPFLWAVFILYVVSVIYIQLFLFHSHQMFVLSSGPFSILAKRSVVRQNETFFLLFFSLLALMLLPVTLFVGLETWIHSVCAFVYLFSVYVCLCEWAPMFYIHSNASNEMETLRIETKTSMENRKSLLVCVVFSRRGTLFCMSFCYAFSVNVKDEKIAPHNG